MALKLVTTTHPISVTIPSTSTSAIGSASQRGVYGMRLSSRSARPSIASQRISASANGVSASRSK